MKTICILLISATLGMAADVTTRRISQYGGKNPLATNDLLVVDPYPNTGPYNKAKVFDVVAQFQAQTPVLWAGPTNAVDLNTGGHNNGDLYYSTFTSVAVTGVLNKQSTNAQTVTLTVYNASATNITITFNAGIMTRDTLRSYTITNAQDLVISFRYHGLLNHTNSVNTPNG